MNARPLKVLLAFEDGEIVRHCARLLAAFGHRVSAAASSELAIARLRADRPDLLVAGGAPLESALSLLRAAVDDSPPQPIFKLLLVNDPTSNDLMKLLEAGADDFILAPLEPAELLARLRTAARILEFERRLTSLSSREGTSGLLSRQALLQRLQSGLSNASIACLVLQPDTYAELRELQGLPAAVRAMQELVKRITDTDRPHSCCGRLDAHRLAVAFPATADEAFAYAEQLRSAVAEAGLESGGEVPWTISLGVAVGSGETAKATQLLEQAEKALLLAQHSGGNRVLRDVDVVQEERRWSELAGGRLFEGAVLRNIMVPFPRLLHTTDTIQRADAAFKQTRLPALPVVDEEGKLAGLLSADHPQPRQVEGIDTPVTQFMNRESVSFDEATTLPVLIDYFTREAPPVVVVVHKGRPTGLVTPESLATLIQPLTTASFASQHNPSGRADLIVPHLCIAD